MNPKLETKLFFWTPFLKVWEILSIVLTHMSFPGRKMTLRTRLNPLGYLAIAFWVSNVWDIESKFHPKSWEIWFSERCGGGPKWVWRSSRESLGARRSAYNHFGCTHKPKQAAPWQMTPAMKMISPIGQENEGFGSFYFAGRSEMIVNDS